MPKIAFSPENKLETAMDFPRLKLDNKEKARIVCLGEPEYAYAHTLQAPKIVDGVAQTHIVERRDKSTFEDYKLEYIGQPQCLGDYTTLQERGVDPENCPICALANTEMALPPVRRFAIHVFQYNLKPKSFDISLPFSGRIVVWRFTDMVFGKLVDITNEWGPLQDIDLNLGPCTNEQFQKFEISNAKTTEWQQDKDRQEYVATALQENRVSDLTSFCGRKTELRWIEQDLETIQERWAVAKGETQAAAVNSAVNLEDTMDNLIGTRKPVVPEPTEPTAAPETNGSGGKLSLDELLKGSK